MLKVAIVGCGKIADEHVAQIQRIQGCEIVAVCDREPLMMQQLCDRFPVGRPYTDFDELLRESQPDVVHVTTPPESHFRLAKRCFEHGCHVYVEKPFTLFESDTRALIAIAEKKGLKLTVGHDAQFSHAARRMRELVQDGFLGHGTVHMESYYCYEMSQDYARALLNDSDHWVRSLPGKLLHNVISHGIARVAEFLKCDSPQIMAYGFVSPALRSMGIRDIIDELRVIISEEERVTAYFTFSTQMRPLLQAFRVYGSKNGLALDHDQETVIKLYGTRYKSYAEKFLPPIVYTRQYLGNLTTNMRRFFANDFHMKAGMKFLMESFYQSIRNGGPLPISYREIVLTAKIMDSIFAQLNAQHTPHIFVEPTSSR
jgi:predicted dehydrogenase